MEKQYKIVLDTLGSDKGAVCMARGAALALEKFPELHLVIVGDEQLLRAELADADGSRITYVHGPDEITNYDNPAMAVFTKPNSSLVKALTTLADDPECVGMINAGSTGALLAGALRYLATPDMQRPALAAIVPAEAGGFVCLVDTGATVDCTPAQLVHFAHLGKAFMHDMYGIENARIGLLSNGKEEGKGNKLVKETYALLKADESLNFVGNLEGNNALSGDCDVLVADGFDGNQIIKCTEGTAKRLIKDIVKLSKKTGNESLMAVVAHLMKLYDFNSLGGGIVLGVRKPVIKAHGAANEQTVVGTAEMLLNLAKNKTII
ncbi:MAG: phosphate--acyl-ACP acyltransferase [Clostridia bacterium]|nr:phosphate--acyl-ACP acyltransferase [Clostridia bacterium]